MKYLVILALITFVATMRVQKEEVASCKMGGIFYVDYSFWGLPLYDTVSTYTPAYYSFATSPFYYYWYPYYYAYYVYRKGEKTYNLSVLNKHQAERFNHKGDLINKEEKTNDLWFSNTKNTDLKVDDLKSCKSVHEQIKLEVTKYKDQAKKETPDYLERKIAPERKTAAEIKK